MILTRLKSQMRNKRILAVLGILLAFGALAYLDTKTFAYSNTDSVTAPASNGYAVTPNDSADLSVACRAIYIGGAGTVIVDFVNSGSSISLVGTTAGSTIPIRVKRIRSTGTTATNLVCLY